jgi:hypothetical protein
MIISFDYKRGINGSEDISNVRRNTRSVLQFPQKGVDVTWDDDIELYTVYFDTEVELDEGVEITSMILEVKRIYLRKQKIKKITDGRKSI